MTRGSKSLRILVVLPDPPLPFLNAVSRWFHVLVRGLVDRGHRVTTFAACRGASTEDEVRSVFPSEEYDLRLYSEVHAPSSLAGKLRSLVRPYSYVYSPRMRADLAREMKNGFDILHLEQLWGGYLGLRHVQKALLHIPYLYSIDYGAEQVTGFRERLLRRRTLQIEPRLLRRYPWISTLTPRLTSEVERASPKSHVQTVPFAMDLTLYGFDPSPPPQRPPTVGLIGSFNWLPSHSAGVRLLDRLWPEIKRRVPAAQLQIVGRKADTAFVNRTDSEDILLASDVPDTTPYFLSTDVLLYAPSRGSGIKVKILEAMALGVPVVTTVEGVEGLPAVDGVEAGISDDDEGLISRTVRLLEDAGRRQAQRRAARSMIESHCSPGPVLDALEAVYDRIASHSK